METPLIKDIRADIRAHMEPDLRTAFAVESIAESQKKMVEMCDKVFKVLGLVLSSDAIKEAIDDENMNKLLDDIGTIINE